MKLHGLQMKKWPVPGNLHMAFLTADLLCSSHCQGCPDKTTGPCCPCQHEPPLALVSTFTLQMPHPAGTALLTAWHDKLQEKSDCKSTHDTLCCDMNITQGNKHLAHALLTGVLQNFSRNHFDAQTFLTTYLTANRLAQDLTKAHASTTTCRFRHPVQSSSWQKSRWLTFEKSAPAAEAGFKRMEVRPMPLDRRLRALRICPASSLEGLTMTLPGPRRGSGTLPVPATAPAPGSDISNHTVPAGYI